LEWWSMLDLNQRPPACEAGALPTELIDRDVGFYVLAGSASTEREPQPAADHEDEGDGTHIVFLYSLLRGETGVDP
jgi:hypothetical protein